ncbi:MAG: hypothetical protein JW827_11135 [Spirochaetes bacterium]|nr:hypothetical protein [Spirochaetota bacterium]
MKIRQYIPVILAIMLVSFSLPAKSTKEGLKGKRIYKFPFYIFSHTRSYSYFALSGYMGDVADMNVVKVKDPYSFKISLKVLYKPTYRQGHQGWCGLSWQYPPNNWGDNSKGGYDLSEAKYLFFYARGSKGNELVEFKIGGIKGAYGDTDEASTGVVPLSKKWKLFKIDLKKKNLKNIVGGFCVLILSSVNPEGIAIYLNDIYYSNKTEPEKMFFQEYSNPGDKETEQEKRVEKIEKIKK